MFSSNRITCRPAAAAIALLVLAAVFVPHAVRTAHATQLTEAAGRGDLDALQEAVSSGADPDEADGKGMTALMRAARGGHYNTSKRLIELGSYVDARDRSGKTALMYAAQGGHVVVGRLLVESGASVSVTDNKGMTAGDIAVKSGQYVMAEYLEGPEADEAGKVENIAGHMRELYSKGRYQAAMSLGLRRREIIAAALGPEDPAVAAAENDLAVVCEALGDTDGAEKYYKSALYIREKWLGPDNMMTALSVNNLGAFLYKSGDIKAAAGLFERSLDALESELGPAHPMTLRTKENLALTRDASGDPAGAHKIRREIEEAQEAADNAALSALSDVAGKISPELAKDAGIAGVMAVEARPAGGPGLRGKKSSLFIVVLSLALAAGAVVAYRVRTILRRRRCQPSTDGGASGSCDVKALYEQAAAAERVGDNAEAARYYEMLLANEPDNHQVRFNLARIYHYGIKNPVKAREHYEALGNSLPPENPYFREAAEFLRLLDSGH